MASLAAEDDDTAMVPPCMPSPEALMRIPSLGSLRCAGYALLVCAAAMLAKELFELAAGAGDKAFDARSLTVAALLGVVAVAVMKVGGAEPKLGRSSKPVLAVDMDEVCCRYLPAYIRYSNAVHGTQLELSDFTSYMFWEVPKAQLADRSAAIERVYAFHDSQYFREIEPVMDANVGLGVLKERFELHVVTSRQSELENVTRAFVDVAFPSTFAELHFGNHFGKPDQSGTVKKLSKPEMCAKIGAVALIDDSLDYAKQCAAAGLPVFLFGQYPWNASKDKLDERITRVANWSIAAQLVTHDVVNKMCC